MSILRFSWHSDDDNMSYHRYFLLSYPLFDTKKLDTLWPMVELILSHGGSLIKPSESFFSVG